MNHPKSMFQLSVFHYRIYRSGLRDGAAGFKAQGLSLRDTALQKELGSWLQNHTWQ